MKKRFLVVYEKGKKNFGGFAPDVPGCFSLGDTLEEMRVNLRDALELYMDSSLELGQPLPEPSSTTITLPLEGQTDLKVTYVVEYLSVNVPRARPTKIKASTEKTASPLKRRRALQVA